MTEPTRPTPGDIVKEETAKQTVILVFTVVGTIIGAYATYLTLDRTAARAARMRATLVVKRVAQAVADKVQSVADAAATEYNRLKN
jgi:hypothetical protein